MKHLSFLYLPAVIIAAAITLSGCSGEELPPSSPPVSSAASSSTVSSASASSSFATAGSASISTESASVSVPERAMMRQYVSVPICGDTENTLLLTLDTPSDWSFDTRSTFNWPDGHKAAEILAVYPVDDELSFPNEITAQYADDGGMYPEGYGLQRSENIRVNGRQILTYYYKSWPDDGTLLWYPRYCFVNLDGYVVQINFFTFEAENNGALFDEIIASMELQSSGTTSNNSTATPSSAQLIP